MKRTKIIYWIFTGLLSAFMLFSAITAILQTKESIALITTHLGYPLYFIPFTGVAKLLGVVALLIPGFPRVKEWAYAGFIFDLIGAIYSLISVGDPPGSWLPILVFIGLVVGSYFYYHKILSEGAHR